MKYIIIATLLTVSCANVNNKPADATDTIEHQTKTDETSQPAADSSMKGSQVYANQRFRNVTIQKQPGNSYLVSGEGRIFEASFNWIIEDGHRELDSGYTTTDMGAPEWGKFSFTIKAPEHSPNSTLHLVLFEISAKDGSRTHELPIPLN